MTYGKLCETRLDSELVLRSAAFDALISTFANAATNVMDGGTDNIAIGKGQCVAGSKTFTVTRVDPERKVVYLADREAALEAFQKLYEKTSEVSTYSARLDVNYTNVGKICSVLSGEDDGWGLPVSCENVPLQTDEIVFGGSPELTVHANTTIYSTFRQEGELDVGDVWCDLSAAERTEAALEKIKSEAGKPDSVNTGFCASLDGQKTYVGKLRFAAWAKISENEKQRHYQLSVKIQDDATGRTSLAGATAVGIPFTVPAGTEFEDYAPVASSGLAKIAEVVAAGGDWNGAMRVWLPDYPEAGTAAASNANAAFGYNCLATGGFSFSTGQSCRSAGKQGFSVGKKSLADGFCAVAMGQNCRAGDYAVALGNNAEAGEQSFVFSGNLSKNRSNGKGTFNVYTEQTGLDGFYVNGKALPDRIFEASESKFLNLSGRDSQTVAGDVEVDGRVVLGSSSNVATGACSFCAGDGANHAGFAAFTVEAVHQANPDASSDVDKKWWIQIAATDAEIEAIDQRVVGQLAAHFGKFQCVLTVRGNGAVETNWHSFCGTDVLGWADKASRKLEVTELWQAVFKNAAAASGSPSFEASDDTPAFSSMHLFFPDLPTLGGNMTAGNGAVCFGYGNLAHEDAAAAGIYNYALGRYSLAAGMNNEAGYGSIALGSGNIAAGAGSIALGGSYSAKDHWQRRGTNCVVKAARAFAWSGFWNGDTVDGDLSKRDPDYVVPEERQGTFNLNPVGGISGIYVGQDDFVECVAKALEKASAAQKARIKAALGL